MAVWRLLAVYLTILVGVVAVSAQRLTALSLSSVPRALWAPFVRPLASAAFEMALLLAVPAAVLAARASGLSLRATLLVATVLIGFNVSASAALDPGSVAPGRIAQQLVDSGRDTCPSSVGHRVEVPLVGLTWSCPPGQPARLSGHTPVGRPKVDYSATSLQVSEDLRQVEVSGLDLVVPASGDRFGLRATFARARLRGLPPWGRPAGRSTFSRLLSSLLACLTTLGAALAILPRLKLGWLLAAMLGAAGGLCPLLANRALDRLAMASLSYWLVVIAGPAAVLLVGLGVAGARRVLGGRSSVAERAS